MKLLVTGGAGFIGSNYVRRCLDGHPDDTVTVLDKLTYAGRLENLDGLADDPRHDFVKGDIADRERSVGRIDGPDAVVTSRPRATSTARSMRPASSSRPTSYGTYVLLRGRPRRRRSLPADLDRRGLRRFEQGSATEESRSTPARRTRPRRRAPTCSSRPSPGPTGAEALIIRSSNNFGPRQHPEKLIPLCILNALAGDPLPVYGDGMQVRNWLYVDDCCGAVDAVLERGEPGQIYNVGGPDELSLRSSTAAPPSETGGSWSPPRGPSGGLSSKTLTGAPSGAPVARPGAWRATGRQSVSSDGSDSTAPLSRAANATSDSAGSERSDAGSSARPASSTQLVQPP